MKKLIIIAVVAVVLIAIAVGVGMYFCFKNEQRRAQDIEKTKPGVINNFEECVEAGYPIMEMYPPQCVANGKTFVQEVTMTEDEAKDIANSSDCVKDGKLKGDGYYNENSKTWWFDLDIQKEDCSPACVVDIISREADINWRCTGLIEE